MMENMHGPVPPSGWIKPTQTASMTTSTIGEVMDAGLPQRGGLPPDPQQQTYHHHEQHGPMYSSYGASRNTGYQDFYGHSQHSHHGHSHAKVSNTMCSSQNYWNSDYANGNAAATNFRSTNDAYMGQAQPQSCSFTNDGRSNPNGSGSTNTGYYCRRNSKDCREMEPYGAAGSYVNGPNPMQPHLMQNYDAMKMPEMINTGSMNSSQLNYGNCISPYNAEGYHHGVQGTDPVTAFYSDTSIPNCVNSYRRNSIESLCPESSPVTDGVNCSSTDNVSAPIYKSFPSDQRNMNLNVNSKMFDKRMSSSPAAENSLPHMNSFNDYKWNHSAGGYDGRMHQFNPSPSNNNQVHQSHGNQYFNECNPNQTSEHHSLDSRNASGSYAASGASGEYNLANPFPSQHGIHSATNSSASPQGQSVRSVTPNYPLRPTSIENKAIRNRSLSLSSNPLPSYASNFKNSLSQDSSSSSSSSSSNYPPSFNFMDATDNKEAKDDQFQDYDSLGCQGMVDVSSALPNCPSVGACSSSQSSCGSGSPDFGSKSETRSSTGRCDDSDDENTNELLSDIINNVTKLENDFETDDDDESCIQLANSSTCIDSMLISEQKENAPSATENSNEEHPVAEIQEDVRAADKFSDINVISTTVTETEEATDDSESRASNVSALECQSSNQTNEHEDKTSVPEPLGSNFKEDVKADMDVVVLSDPEEFLNIGNFFKENAKCPKKIAKRSFSETDKDLVMNTTAVSSSSNSSSEKQPDKEPSSVCVPNGWKRNVLCTNGQLNSSKGAVEYVTPSGTLLKTLAEVKNYITSNGTCKCGLGCPVHLNQYFSFNPDISSQYEVEMSGGYDGSRLCRHKRKITKNEHSPLISSTREDLDECEQRKRKRSETLTISSPPKIPSSNTESPCSNQIIPVPALQQSPDTTTQTPQTEMSPASSLTSESSLPQNINDTRSNSSTPTPQGPKSSPVATSSRVTSSSSFLSKQTVTSSKPCDEKAGKKAPKTTSTIATSTSTTKPVVSIRRGPSPCPNIDVRQIPPEHNLPPPKPVDMQSSFVGATSQPAIVNAPNSSNILVGTNVLSNPCGYSILPVPFPTSTITRTVPVNNVILNPLPTSTNPLMLNDVSSLLPSSIASSLTVSLVDAPKTSEPTTTPVNVTCDMPPPSAAGGAGEKENEKSPLQMVQDVVNRFPSKEASSVVVKSGGDVNCCWESGVKRETNEQSKEESSDLKEETPKPVVPQDANSAKTIGSSQIDTSKETDAPPFMAQEPLAGKEDQKLPLNAGTSEKTNATPTTSTTCSAITTVLDVQVQNPSQPQVMVPCLSDTTTTASTTTLMSSGINPATQPLRYPLVQTVQPFLFNSTNTSGAPLIISQTPNQPGDITQPIFFEQPQLIQSQDPAGSGPTTLFSSHTGQPMLLDPNTCNIAGIAPIGGKKKKKRLSKKQQQQQAQMQLQQQLLLQQLYQQQQQPLTAAPSMPFTILQNPFQPQGLNIQPMNFIQTPAPTILTLPNLLLNPVDGTLYIQPTQQLSNPSGTPPISTISVSCSSTAPMMTSTNQPISLSIPGSLTPDSATKSDVLKKPDIQKGDSSTQIDDTRRNPTPDSSTNDIQLGLSLPSSGNPKGIGMSPTPLSTAGSANSAKKMGKGRLVSSSTVSPSTKRVSKILPKIDSTTNIDNG